MPDHLHDDDVDILSNPIDAVRVVEREANHILERDRWLGGINSRVYEWGISTTPSGLRTLEYIQRPTANEERRERECYFCPAVATEMKGRLPLCAACLKKHSLPCDNCGTLHISDHYQILHHFADKKPKRYCDQCDATTCRVCGCGGLLQEMKTVRGMVYCPPCYQIQRESLRALGGTPTVLFPTTRLIGVEIEAVNGVVEPLDMFQNSLSNSFDLHHDGSLRGDTTIELVTKPFGGDKFEQTLKKVLSVLRRTGWSTNKSCGLHVHFDADDIAQHPKYLSRIMHTYQVFEPFLYSLLRESRKDNRYCYSISRINYRRLIELLATGGEIEQSEVDRSLYQKWDNARELFHKKLDKYAESNTENSVDLHYFGVNLHSVNYRKTLEIRYHHGTLEENIIACWVSLNLHMIEYCMQHYVYREVEKYRVQPITLAAVTKLFNLPEQVQEYVSAQQAASIKR